VRRRAQREPRGGDQAHVEKEEHQEALEDGPTNTSSRACPPCR
jgi:hypothetical protein